MGNLLDTDKNSKKINSIFWHRLYNINHALYVYSKKSYCARYVLNLKENYFLELETNKCDCCCYRKKRLLYAKINLDTGKINNSKIILRGITDAGNILKIIIYNQFNTKINGYRTDIHIGKTYLNDFFLCDINEKRKKYKIISSPKPKTIQIPDTQCLCVICMDEPANMVIIPCGHMVMCQNCCHNDITFCPMCRKSFTKDQLLRVYKS